MLKNNNFFAYIIYMFLKVAFFCLTKLLFFTRVKGIENLPANGPFIIAANHTSFADAAVISVHVPFTIRWITRKDVYNKWFLKPFHKLFGSVVSNGSVDKALSALREGDIVGIFPEGGRSPDGKLKKGKEGAAILALKSGCEVVPIGISGLFEAYGRSRVLPRPGRALVNIGRPLVFKRTGDELIDDAILKKTIDEIMSGIKGLMADI